MNAVGKIGLIMPDVTDLLEQNLIDGVFSKAKALGYDVILLTGAFNSQPELMHDAYICGLENIYELLLQARLDGVIFAADRFHNEAVRERVYELIAQAGLPCVVIGQENAHFPSVFPRQHDSMKLVTEHLIAAHGCRKIYCITGVPGNRDSDERLAGYYDAMQAAGLPVQEDWIFYGGFWITEPIRIAREIANGTIPKPDAVVCASDIMAMMLTKTLVKNGVSVPDEIRITGYDGGFYSFMNQPSITTVYGRDYELGQEAFCKLYALCGGTAEASVAPYQNIRFGNSCGCGNNTSHVGKDRGLWEYVDGQLKDTLDVKMIITSNLVQKLSHCTTLDGWIESVAEQAHSLLNWEWLDVCLCEDWKFDFSNPEIYREHGFSDQMYLALSKRQHDNGSDGYYFPTADLLPALNQPHEPVMVVITSLHYSHQVFGYLAARYDRASHMCINEYYLYWCDAICNGLGMLQNHLYAEHIKNQFALLSVHDPSTGMLNLRGFLEQLPLHLARCSKSKQHGVLMMLSVLPRHGKAESLGMDDALITANTIRMSTLPQELQARISDDVFLLALCGDAIKPLADERLAAIQRALDELKGGNLDFQLPKYVMAYESLENQSITDICERIEAMRSRMLEKRNLADAFYTDFREEIQQVRREIYLHPQNEWSAADIAQKIGISRSHFHRLYKAAFSVSCHDDVIQARIKKATRLLETTDMRIQDIADACGYAESCHFIRQFKSKMGVTATEYRKQLK